MTDKDINVKYKSYDKYEGRKVRPAVVSKGMQANIDDYLEIRCIKYRSQLENKLHIEKIIKVLERENLL